MQNLIKWKQTRLALKKLKRDFNSGVIDYHTFLTTRAELKFNMFEIENSIDGIGSPSEDMKFEIPQAPEEIPQAPEEIPQAPEEIPQAPEEIPQAPEEIPQAPEEFPQAIASDPVILRVVHALGRFPHLSLIEILAFIQTVQANGGSTLTHSGVFAVTCRRWSNKSRRLRGQYDFYCSWTCCSSIIEDSATPTHVISVKCRKSDKPIGGVYEAWVTNAHSCEQSPCTHPDLHKSAPDLKNCNPIGRCESPAIFHLIPKCRQSGNSTK